MSNNRDNEALLDILSNGVLAASSSSSSSSSKAVKAVRVLTGEKDPAEMGSDDDERRSANNEEDPTPNAATNGNNIKSSAKSNIAKGASNDMSAKAAEDDDPFDGDLDEDLLEAVDAAAAAVKDEPRNKKRRKKKSMFDVEEEEEEEEEPEVKSEPSAGLTAFQQSRAEKNRLKAISLRKARLMTSKAGEAKDKINIVTGEKMKDKAEKKVVDSGAGFFIEEDGEGGDDAAGKTLTELPAPIIEPERCLECDDPLRDSYLFRNFDLCVCDRCKDPEKDGAHELITKTEAKNVFLLKDHQMENLKFILKKNPHNHRWGDMRLYLRLQVEEVALGVWGTEEALEAEHEKRGEKKEKGKIKRFNRRIRELRMQVRGSLFKKDLAVHEHEFGEEGYDEEADEYFRSCNTCQFSQRYEKM